MKNIFRLLVPCFVLMTAVSSCYDEMDSKASIDDRYAGSIAPVVSLTDASVVSFSSIQASGSIEDNENTMLEVGVMVATSSDFAAYNAYPAAEVGNTFSVSVRGLEDNTTYYVRTYAVSEASGIAVSEAQTLSTPVAPIFDLDGVYSANQYAIDASTGVATLDDTYKVTIAFVDGSTTNISITNLFNGGRTISGVYNPARGTFTVARGTVMGDHPTYGEIFINPVDDEIASYLANATFTFQTKGGFLNSSIWAASVSAGNLGFFRVEMAHD